MKRFPRHIMSRSSVVLAVVIVVTGIWLYQIRGTSQPPEANQGRNTPTSTPAPALCTPSRHTIDLKILVLAADGKEATLPAITQALDYLAVPYTVNIVTRKPGGLTSTMLANGCHGYYQGIILTEGNLSYQVGARYVSALSPDEWAVLRNYEARWGIRQVNWYASPTADLGYQQERGEADTDNAPLLARLTEQGKSVFSYLNPYVSIPIRYAYTYLALPLKDGNTTPLLTDSQGNALAVIHTTRDKRQVLSLTFDSNPNLIHSIVLSYGLINWLTRGLFPGERHIVMSPQVDDMFIADDLWPPGTPCQTDTGNTGVTYRITGADLQALMDWQNSKHDSSIARHLTLTLAFNGYGTTAAGGGTSDTLTPIARANRDQFYWVSHTYDHTNLDHMNYADARQEIQRNLQVATDILHMTNFSSLTMVTPDVSGLTNPSFLQAAHDMGIRYLVTDTSRKGYDNPSPDAGIYNKLQPQILMIPRYPTDLFYNVSTPDSWVAEYNCIYEQSSKHKLTYQEILDSQSNQLLIYLLRGDLNPWMFHQANLQAYDGVHSLLGDLIDATLQKYTQYYNLPIMFPTMNSLGQTIAERMQYHAAGVTARIVPGTSITITAQKAARVPVTGLNSADAEFYGGQYITYVNLAAGQSITLPLK